MIYVGWNPVIAELHKIRPAPICEDFSIIPPAFHEDPIAIIANFDSMKKSTFPEALFPVLLSSAEVFPGTWGDFSEQDPPFPLTPHGCLSLAQENVIKAYFEDFLIIRYPDIMYSGSQIDIKMSWEPFDIIAEKVLFLVDNQATGIYHIGGMRRSLYQISKDILHNKEIPELSSDYGMNPIDFSLNVSRYNKFVEEKNIHDTNE